MHGSGTSQQMFESDVFLFYCSVLQMSQGSGCRCIWSPGMTVRPAFEHHSQTKGKFKMSDVLGGYRRSGVSQWVIHKPNKTNIINIVFMQTSEVIYQRWWTNCQHHHNFNCGNKQSFLSNRMVTKDKSRNSNIHRLTANNSLHDIIIKPGQDGLLRMHMAD